MGRKRKVKKNSQSNKEPRLNGNVGENGGVEVGFSFDVKKASWRYEVFSDGKLVHIETAKFSGTLVTFEGVIRIKYGNARSHAKKLCRHHKEISQSQNRSAPALLKSEAVSQ